MSPDLERLLADQRRAPAHVAREAFKATEKSANRIKHGMRESARLASPRHAPHFPRSITYDLAVRGAVITAEVGPDKDIPGAQGALGNVLAYGTRNNAPVWDHHAPLHAELPVLEDYLARAGEDPFR